MPAPRKPAEPSRVYQHFKAVFGDPSKRGLDARRRRAAGQDPDSVPYGKGREPTGLGDVMGALTAELGWTEPLARSELFVDWPSVVGEELAKHSTPVTIEDGALVIRCALPGRGGRVDPGFRAGRPHVETRPQVGPGARSSRYLRLTRRNHPSVGNSSLCGAYGPWITAALR
jgi:predicted nucleic acid-binding Zn ribbon protein